MCSPSRHIFNTYFLWCIFFSGFNLFEIYDFGRRYKLAKVHFFIAGSAMGEQIFLFLFFFFFLARIRPQWPVTVSVQRLRGVPKDRLPFRR
jgi:hypothetical protein